MTGKNKTSLKPWTYHPDGDGRGYINYPFENSATGRKYIAHDVRDADGALIVKAVNSHDALLEACTAAMAALEEIGQEYREAKMRESTLCGAKLCGIDAEAIAKTISFLDDTLKLSEGK